MSYEFPKWHVVIHDESPGYICATVSASTADRAAEVYRETDEGDWEFGEQVNVSVRKVGDDGEWKHFAVTREYEPEFYANALDDPPDGWEDPVEEDV
jgi:hypothetical protein